MFRLLDRHGFGPFAEALGQALASPVARAGDLPAIDLPFQDQIAIHLQSCRAGAEQTAQACLPGDDLAVAGCRFITPVIPAKRGVGHDKPRHVEHVRALQPHR